MPSEVEKRVMRLLSAIEVEPQAAGEAIVAWGNEAVTVVCETALGAYPGLRPKMRTNAVALLGWIDHPQADEALLQLLNDDDQDVAVRAARAAGRRKSEAAVDRLSQALQREQTTPIAAAEALTALLEIGSPRASTAVADYEKASAQRLPHRGSRVVAEILALRRTV